MVASERLLRVTIEVIFVLLGALVAWLALRKHIFVDRHGKMWLILSIVLVLWGLRVLYKPGQWWTRRENWIRGLSLALLGGLMLAMIRVPFAWVGPMLVAGGGILVLRGIIASTLLFRPR